MNYLTDEYIKFMDNVKRPDKYTNADPQAALIEHYNMDPHLAKKIYDEWIRLVYMRMPWRPTDE